MHHYIHRVICIYTQLLHTIVLLVRERWNGVDGELLFKPRMEPIVVFVSTADSPVSTGWHYLIGSKTLDAFKLLLF